MSEHEVHAAEEAGALRASQDVELGFIPCNDIGAIARVAVEAALPILRPEGMTLVGRCRDCRFWDVVGSRTYGLCGDDHGPLHLERTTPDFGCVHFQRGNK